MTSALIAVDALSDRIHLVRGQRAMLDSDLAELYGVATKVFNQAIKRNIDRFPSDFILQLTEEEGVAAVTSPTSSPNTAQSWPSRSSTCWARNT
jgi:hypothetical protein